MINKIVKGHWTEKIGKLKSYLIYMYLQMLS